MGEAATYDRHIGPGSRPLLAVIAAAAVALAAASEAAANSTLDASPSGSGLFLVSFEAAPAKANQVDIALTRTSVSFTDPGDPIDEAVAECTGGGTNTVTCLFPSGIGQLNVQTLDLDDSVRIDAPEGMPGGQGLFGLLSVTGGDGGDEITVIAPPGAPGESNLDGDDSVDPAGDGGDVLMGGGMRDSIEGNGGVDVLLGGEGDDTLFPGPGNAERADGGPGDDSVVYEAGEGNGELLEGGAGVDTLFFRGPNAMLTPAPAALGVDLAAGSFISQTAGGTASGSGTNFEFMGGQDYTFTVAGTDGHNRLATGESDDMIDPRGGPDRVRAGSGADRVLARDGFTDRIECGPGDDSVVVDQFDEPIDCETVDLAEVLPVGVERDAPVCSVTGAPRRITRRRFLRGLRPLAGCNEAVTLEAQLTVAIRRRRGRLVTVRAGQLVLAERALPFAAEARRVVLRVPRPLRRALGRRFTANLTVVARDQFGNRSSIRRTVRVR